MKTKIKRGAIVIHRWMGIGFCILFAAWFVSGIVMMYQSYPRIAPRDRYGRAATLDIAALKVSPAEAFASLHEKQLPQRVTLGMLDRRPIYRFTQGRQQLLVFADSGERVELIPAQTARRVATAWTNADPVTEERITEADSWTVNPSVFQFKPFMKYTWASGEEVYVSQTTGEVAQYTTPGIRLANYFGAIPHWLYFTALRRDQTAWHNTVTWLSGVGTIMSLLGLIIGVWLYSPSKQYRYASQPTSVPYTGQKRWHTILGLVFGLTACTWAFSGMLSMGPFRWLRRDSDAARIQETLRAKRVPLEAIRIADLNTALERFSKELNVKEIELLSLAGERAYLGVEAPGRSRLLFAGQGAPAEFATERILSALSSMKGAGRVAQTRMVTEYESYYVDRKQERPLPALFVQMDDANGSMHYIDPRTGLIAQSYSAGSKWNRWLYHGLHSFDLPILYKYRPVWDIIVLILMVGGSALCVTSVILAWQRLAPRTSRRRSVIRTPSSTEDANAPKVAI